MNLIMVPGMFVCSSFLIMISDCTVLDFISDYRLFHASLQCIRPHPVRKQIAVRALRRIKDDALAEDLDRFNVDQGCVDVDIMIEVSI